MRIFELTPKLWVLMVVTVTLLERVHSGDCAGDKSGRKMAGTKKYKNGKLKGYKSMLRSMVMDGPMGIGDSKSSGEKNPAKKLNNDLFGRYNKNARPVRKTEETTKVGFGIAIVEVLALEEASGHTTIHTWVKMTWNDAGLTWNPKEYDGIEEIHVPVKSIWRPDITLYNSNESEDPISKDVDAVITSDGTVLWVAPATFKVTCRHEFRGNSWSCPFRFGSWTYNGFQLDIVPFDGVSDMDSSEYLLSDYFEIVAHTGKRDVKTYPGSDVPYPFMNYLLKLRNKIGPSLMGK